MAKWNGTIKLEMDTVVWATDEKGVAWPAAIVDRDYYALDVDVSRTKYTVMARLFNTKRKTVLVDTECVSELTAGMANLDQCSPDDVDDLAKACEEAMKHVQQHGHYQQKILLRKYLDDEEKKEKRLRAERKAAEDKAEGSSGAGSSDAGSSAHGQKIGESA